jgi:hypothetical protein
MITEDYVSFETAKLLKEKGFDEPCECLYDTENNDVSIVNGWMTVSNSELEEREFVCYSAPTLQMAMKWLREEHNLFIGIHPRLSFTDYYWITADIYRVKKKSSFYHMGDGDDYNCVACCDGTSFEGDCESAIKYCLEHLI